MESCNEQMDRRLFNTSVKKCEQLAKSFKRCVLGPSMGRWRAGRPPAEGLGSEEEVRARGTSRLSHLSNVPFISPKLVAPAPDAQQTTHAPEEASVWVFP